MHTERLKQTGVEILLAEGNGRLRVSGDSMRPHIHDGDTVLCAPFTGKAVPGKCYVFRIDGRMRMHRLVYATSERACFLGDNARNAEVVPYSAIVARYAGRENPFRQTIIAILNAVFYFVDRVNIRALARVVYILRRRYIFYGERS